MIDLLVVDDNTAETYLVLYALESLGKAVNCHYAKDGTEALRVLNEKKFDLVILDLNLPGVSGYDVLKQCDTGSVPVVVFSLSSSDADAKRALDLGARQFVHKPAVLNAYRDTVIKMIETWVPA
jgi:CheY-like chemotaxis protein